MKKISTVLSLIVVLTASFLAPNAQAATPGYIYLQVEQRGQAWYLSPLDGKRYYLGAPEDAFAIMKRLSLGAKHAYIADTEVFPARLRGLILLDVEQRGEAYYIDPRAGFKHYLGNPIDALAIMRQHGQGITDANLNKFPMGDINETAASASLILLDAPFTSQAPRGDWNDPRQADGCEEASALMAVRWARGQHLLAEDAIQEITAMSEYERANFGEFRDTSAVDTMDRLVKGYLGHQNAELKRIASSADIIDALRNQRVVIAPIDGNAVDNIYFLKPPPPNHMLLIVGYDPIKKVFLANDPGTAHGARYEYKAEQLFNAIRDYPTGYRLPITEIRKDVILVWK